MLLVDSHCHLDCLDFSKEDLPDDLAAVLANAKAHDVQALLCVCITLENFPTVLQLAEAYDYIYASVGVHPTEQDGAEPDIDKLLDLATHPRVVAIGETGLDYYWLKDKPEWQRQRFITHIAASKRCNKPLIVHSREAKVDTIRIMQEQQATRGVMHCFAEDYAMAKQAIDLGFYISFSGIVTFKNAKILHEVAKKIPLDSMLIETDSPYLAPMPFRGKSNQPAYVKYVAEHIAKLRNQPLAEIAEQTTRNFETLFNISVTS